MSEQVNKNLSKAEDVFKCLIWDGIIKVELAALYTASPVAAFFKPAIDYIANYLGDWIFSKIKMAIDIEAIKFINHKAEENFKKASVTLSIIAHDKGIDSDEYKKARETAQQALSQFVRFSS